MIKRIDLECNTDRKIGRPFYNDKVENIESSGLSYVTVDRYRMQYKTGQTQIQDCSFNYDKVEDDVRNIRLIFLQVCLSLNV